MEFVFEIHRNRIVIRGKRVMDVVAKLKHQRSQSEIVIGDILKFRKLNRPLSSNQLKTTNVNRLYRVSGCEDLPSSPKGRPRSWTWNGSGSSQEDKGEFLVEDDTSSENCASLKTYSHESLLDDIEYDDAKAASSDVKFEKAAVKDIISDVLVTEFLNGHYDAAVAMEQCALVSQRIQSAVTNMLDLGVKVIATVHMGEQKGQAVEISCQCLWDAEQDNLVTVSFQDQALFAICTVFVVHT